MTLPVCSKEMTSASVVLLCPCTPSVSSPTATVTFTHLVRKQAQIKHQQTWNDRANKNKMHKNVFKLLQLLTHLPLSAPPGPVWSGLVRLRSVTLWVILSVNCCTLSRADSLDGSVAAVVSADASTTAASEGQNRNRGPAKSERSNKQ